jgi:hypothetical protein
MSTLIEKLEALVKECEHALELNINGAVRIDWLMKRLAALLADHAKEGEQGRCPTCHSPGKNLHPAVQFEGEVQPCEDDWHKPAPKRWKCEECGISGDERFDWHRDEMGQVCHGRVAVEPAGEGS